MAETFTWLVFLHVLGASVWLGGTVAIALTNRALRRRLPDVERRDMIRYLGRASGAFLWGAFTLAAISGFLLWRERGFFRPSFAYAKMALALLAVLLMGTHVWLGRRERLRPAIAAMLGMATLAVGLALLALGAWLRAH